MKHHLIVVFQVLHVNHYNFYVDELTVGDVGYIIASIKNVDDSRVGDTITLANRPAEQPLQINR
jgi:translation elongation factor EF-4